MPGIMLGPLIWRHGGEPGRPLVGIPLLVTKLAIEFGLADGCRAVRKLNHMPLSAARRLPAVQPAPPVFHCRIAARLAITFPDSAAPWRGPELRQVFVCARPGYLPEGG